jgi:hypothetical protein
VGPDGNSWLPRLEDGLDRDRRVAPGWLPRRGCCVGPPSPVRRSKSGESGEAGGARATRVTGPVRLTPCPFTNNAGYAVAYATSAHRTAALERGLHYDNWHRRHSALNGQPAITRVVAQDDLVRLHT